MTTPPDDRLRFPEPRRSALRTLLVDQTVTDGATGPLSLGLVDATHSPGPVGSRHGRGRTVAAVLLVAAAVVALIGLVLVLPDGADRSSPTPAASPSTTSSPRTGVFIGAVPVITPGAAAAPGWSRTSCPYLEQADAAALLGASVGDVWSGAGLPVACRLFSPSGTPLLDVTTLGEDAPGKAGDTAAALAAAGTDQQPTHTAPGATDADPATVWTFRTDGLDGTTGWAAAVAQDSTTFLVRAAAAVDRDALDRVVAEVVDVATSPGGSALTSSLRSCARLVGEPFSDAVIGGQVTCTLGGDHPLDLDIRQGPCPDGTVFYAFASTASDATDHATYYGATPTTLLRTTAPVAEVVATGAAQACPG